MYYIVYKYGITNHLGNVLVTISDRIIKAGTVGNTATYLTADVKTATDYYPFGMAMPGRTYTAGTAYRYGFNGKENSAEINSGAVTFEARIYDSRIGRFFSTDPRQGEYAWQSTYVYFSNCPTSIVDFKGGGSKDPIPPMVMAERHNINKFGNLAGSSASKNEITSVIINAEWAKNEVLEGFYKEAQGLAIGTKGKVDVTLNNGSIWNIDVKTGHFFPKGDGKNVIDLSGEEASLIDDVCKGNIRNGGTNSKLMESLQKALEGRNMPLSENLQKVIGALSEKFSGSINEAVATFEGSLLKPDIELPNDIRSRYNIKAGTENFVKFAGRNILKVATAGLIAYSVYEIVVSDNPALEVGKQLTTFAAFSEGFAIGAGGTSFSGPGCVLGGLFGGLLAAALASYTIDAIESTTYTVNELINRN